VSEGLRAVAGRLRCPHCGRALSQADGSLRCELGHTHDVARRGWVTLLPGGGRAHPGDTAAMATAREAFLGGGHFDAISEAVADALRGALGERAMRPGCLVDVGAGTGRHLSHVLRRLPGWSGLALDASRPALRRALRAHPRIGAVACDVWRELPLLDGAADAAIDVFAPRNGPELARVLAPGAPLVVVTPGARHLEPLVEVLGLLRVDERKAERLVAALGTWLEPAAAGRTLAYDVRLARDEVRLLVAMGPSAHHAGEAELARRIERLPDPAVVRIDVRVDTWRQPARSATASGAAIRAGSSRRQGGRSL
jgi:23S rRNA (guanine745-N1)-methyltransferase